MISILVGGLLCLMDRMFFFAVSELLLVLFLYWWHIIRSFPSVLDITPSCWFWLFVGCSLKLEYSNFWIIEFNCNLDDGIRSRIWLLVLVYVWFGLSFGVLILIGFVDVMLDSWSVVCWWVVRFGVESLEEILLLWGNMYARYGWMVARCCRLLLEISSIRWWLLRDCCWMKFDKRIRWILMNLFGNLDCGVGLVWLMMVVSDA